MDNIDNKVDDIHKYLFRCKQHATLHPSDTFIRQQMPPKPAVFHGRDDIVKDIAQLLLQEETSRVCILGPGGMGKTSTSLAVVESPLLRERFPPANCVWVPCIEATSATLLLEIIYIQLQVPVDNQVTLERIISELDSSKEPRLILLDNFETPWNAPGEWVRDILHKLAELSHIAIFVTMRGANPPCHNVIEWQSMNMQPTDEEACLRIYHDNNPDSKDDPDVPRLLAVLGHMPFAVTLMANLGMDGRSTAKELLDAWLESGPDMLSDGFKPEQSMNRSISLSVESNLVKRNPNAITLLAILSLLPAGTTKKNLRWWAPALKTSMIPSAIATLSRAALLIENKQQTPDSPVFFVVPVVQSFMQQHGQEQHPRIPEEVRNQIQSAGCRYVLDHACRPHDLQFSVKSKALAAEDTNIQSVLFSSPTLQHTVLSDRTMEALIAFGWHRCDIKPSVEIANHVVTAANASGVERYKASAVWCLGKTYDRIGDHRHSYDRLLEAYRLFNILPSEVESLESQRLGGQCGIDLAGVARSTLQDKGKAVSLARDVEMKCAALSDNVIHGRSLNALGIALTGAGQPQEALVHLDRARAMLRAVGDTPNLANAYRFTARVHYKERRLPEALDAVQEAWKLIESSAIANQHISLEFGKILFSANRDTEAWEYIETALMTASFIGNRHDVAKALEYMGYGYLRRGDYQNAYGAYEAAAEKYPGTVSVSGEERCKENMARIKQKQANTDADIGFYRHGYDVDQSLFFPPLQEFSRNDPISDPLVISNFSLPDSLCI
jgi:tetratricopeptide (TPR) repeat protein